MFFVGATGQVLTLILTVSLPLIMLVSGQPKNEIKKSQQEYKVQLLQEFQTISDCQYNIEFADFYTENQKCPLFYIELEIFKLPLADDKVKWKTFCLNESGNKAPPLYV